MRLVGGIRFSGCRINPSMSKIRFSGNKLSLNTPSDNFGRSTNTYKHFSFKHSHPLLYFLGFNFLMRKEEEKQN